MQALLYSVSLFFYGIGIHLASPFNAKAREFIRGRKESWSILRKIKNDPSQVIWVHCASLGEFEQGRPVIEKLRKQFPSHRIVLTFFSPSGYKVRKNYSEADYVLYLPMDTRSNARKWVEELNPAFAIFVKYEFWHFYIREMHDRNIPVISVSAIFRKEQIYFRPAGSFYRRILMRITHFFVQDHTSAELLYNLGIDMITVAGDTRFDRVTEIRNNRKEIPEARAFAGQMPVLVAGSVWPEDMEVLIPFINTHDLKFIIAPHELQEKFMARIEQELEKKCIRYSAWDEVNGPAADVLIIDNIGMLSSLYAYARYAWVGGAFGQGLHNILEAAVYGCPVFFGNKNYKKFREARDLVNLGSAVPVGNYMELKEQFATFNQGTTYAIAREINMEYINSNRGASDLIVRYCTEVLK